MTSDKFIHVENRPSWRSEHGNILKHLSYMSSILRLINSHVDLENRPLKIIDYGCAYGYYLQVLKLINPEHEVYGVEIALDAVTYAREKIGKDKIFWQSCGDSIPLPDDSVDLILCSEVIEHISDEEVLTSMLNECNRLLKKDGYLIIKTPNCSLLQKTVFWFSHQSWIYKGSDHPNPFNEKKLRKLVEPYLMIDKIIYHQAYASSVARILKITRIDRLLTRLKLAFSLIFVLRKR